MRATRPIFFFRWVICPFAFLAFMLSGCGMSKPDLNAEADLRLSMKHARGLVIWKTEQGHKVVVRNPQDTSQVLATYILHSSELGENDTLPSMRKIKVPIENAALQSTTFVSFFDKIGASDVVGGLSYTDQIQNEGMKKRIASGLAVEINSGNEIDLERLLALAPDLLMVYQYGDSDFSRFSNQGIPVVYNMEYAEATPLARAEWVKLVGLLTGRYDEAHGVFEAIETRYRKLKADVSLQSFRPKVFTGSKFGSSWFAPGRDSFVAQFIRDAGGTYSFDYVTGQGSAELDFEGVLSVITQADYWGFLVSSETDFSYRQVLELDGVYSELKSFKKGQIFVCNTLKTDYFGDAVMEPDVVLADIVGVLHPDLIPDHVFTYFRPITE